MALLTGFPPSNLISPSVRITEVDFSFLSPITTAHRAGLVGFCSKGPINVPTMVTTISELHTTFGWPHPDVGDPYLIYAGEQYLQFGSELFIVRVGITDPVDDNAATTATIDVPAAGGPVAIISNVTGPYTFANDVFFRWRLNGVLASKTLVVLADANRPAPNAGQPYTVTDLVNTLNLQLNFAIDGIQFNWDNPDPITGAATGSSHIVVQSTFSYGPAASIELVSVQDALYGPVWNGSSFVAPVSGLGQGMLEAQNTGTQDRYPQTSSQTPGTYDFSALTGLNLEIVVDGTDNILIDNIVQTVTIENDSSTIADIVADINAQIGVTVPGGFVAFATGNNLTISTLASGDDSRLLIKSDSTSSALFGLDSLTHVGVSPADVSGSGTTYVDGIVTGSLNTGVVCFTLTADSPGIDGNATQVIVTNNVSDGNFSLQVFSYGSSVEAWGLLSKNPASSYYVESFLAISSDYIQVIDNTATLALPQNGTYQLGGDAVGTDGIPADPDTQDTLLAGNATSMTGLQALSDPEQINIDLIAIPGHPSTNNVLAMIALCQARQDCMCIVEPPFGLNVTEIINWQNGTHPLNDVQFDSNYAALYWPWVQIRDTFNQVNVWVPPAGVVLGVYAHSDSLSFPWFAPAGTTRGVCETIIDTFSKPTLAERDAMYGSTNAVNPIAQFPDIPAFCVFGQKTLQRMPSALDRVNVRRMLLFIEKAIKLGARSLIFEPNDSKTWARFVAMATLICQGVQSNRGINQFQIQCDATLNTPDVINLNEMRARVGVIPTYAVEFIFIEFAIFATGSDFSEPDSTFSQVF